MNTAEIVAIVLGSITGVLLIIFLYFYFKQVRLNRESQRAPVYRSRDSGGSSAKMLRLQEEISQLQDQNNTLLADKYGSTDNSYNLRDLRDNVFQEGGIQPDDAYLDKQGVYTGDDGTYDPYYYDEAPF